MKKALLSVIVQLLFFSLHAQQVNYTPLFTNTDFVKNVDFSRPVGVIEGYHNVSATGAATYSIPIKIAPGTDGMIPKISIEYNSQTGNGIAGYGWTISGISIISKAQKNYYFDRDNRGMTPASYGPLSLDGKRLVENNTVTGVQTSDYYNELSDFTKIIAFGQYGSYSYDWLSVTTKDGNVQEYGHSNSSRIFSNVYTANDEVSAWYLSKIKNEAGNYVQYNYANLGGETLIDEILYTGNSTNAPYNKVKFIYRTRSDDNIIYQTGTALPLKNILDRIEIYHEGTVFRTYELKYGFAEGYSFLKEIAETGADGGQLNTTIFKYGDLNDNVATTSTNIPLNSEDRFAGDFDGDGIGDIVIAPQSSPGYHSGYTIYRGNTSGTNLQVYASGTFPPSETSTLKSLFGIRKYEVPNSGSGVFSSDFDKDGRDDIVRPVVRASGSTFVMDKVNIIYSTGNGQMSSVDYYLPYNNNAGYEVDPAKSFILIGDYNGDKAPDMLAFVKDRNQGFAYKILFFTKSIGSWITVQTPTQMNQMCFDAKSIFTINYDGDEATEVLAQDPSFSLYRIFKLTPISAQGSISMTLQISGNMPHNDFDLWPGDFNGDGKTDLLRFDANNSKWQIGFIDCSPNTYYPVLSQAYAFQDWIP